MTPDTDKAGLHDGRAGGPLPEVSAHIEQRLIELALLAAAAGHARLADTLWAASLEAAGAGSRLS